MATHPDAWAQPTRDAGNASGPGSVEELTRRNVDRIVALEATEHGKATTRQLGRFQPRSARPRVLIRSPSSC